MTSVVTSIVGGIESVEQRADTLRALGARDDAVRELLAYGASGFDPDALDHDAHTYPLPDEPFVDAWERYAEQARAEGAVPVLRRHLIQLRFPVERGTGGRDDYLAATRRGIMPAAGACEESAFRDPVGISIALHPTPAGRLPVVFTTARADFELLIRALTRRNEPEPIPPSMGACIVGGYNNWGRVRELRDEWARRRATLGACTDDAAWGEEFQRIVPRRELYQDRFVVLSAGPYSGTRAAELGRGHQEWRELSLVIRLEHECAHYFTRRVFGSMRNSLLDELIADFTGIVAAAGRFEPGWLLRFMGVEGGTFRNEGRLVNYRGSPPLSDAAWPVLQEMVRRAAATLARFDVLVRGGEAGRSVRTPAEVARAITVIASAGLERLTEPDAADAMYARYAGAPASITS